MGRGLMGKETHYKCDTKRKNDKRCRFYYTLLVFQMILD